MEGGWCSVTTTAIENALLNAPTAEDNPIMLVVPHNLTKLVKELCGRFEGQSMDWKEIPDLGKKRGT
eukprot:4744306-Prorocentrum_lima.AAC.1